MLYYHQNSNWKYWIKDKNLSNFKFGPFDNIWIKWKRIENNENFDAKNLKTREDRIWKYKKIFFVKRNWKITIYPTLKNYKNFDWLIIYKIFNLQFINPKTLNFLTNYKFHYKIIEPLPNIKYLYVDNLNFYLLPILNGLFGEYLFSFKYIIEKDILFNLPFEINKNQIEKLEVKTNELLSKLQQIKKEKILIWYSLKKQINNSLKDILLSYVKLVTNFYIVIINSLREKWKLNKLRNLPETFEEYKWVATLLENTLENNINEYILFYKKISTLFQIYSYKLIKLSQTFLNNN